MTTIIDHSLFTQSHKFSQSCQFMKEIKKCAIFVDYSLKLSIEVNIYFVFSCKTIFSFQTLKLTYHLFILMMC